MEGWNDEVTTSSALDLWNFGILDFGFRDLAILGWIICGRLTNFGFSKNRQPMTVSIEV